MTEVKILKAVINNVPRLSNMRVSLPFWNLTNFPEGKQIKSVQPLKISKASNLYNSLGNIKTESLQKNR